MIYARRAREGIAAPAGYAFRRRSDKRALDAALNAGGEGGGRVALQNARGCARHDSGEPECKMKKRGTKSVDCTSIVGLCRPPTYSCGEKTRATSATAR